MQHTTTSVFDGACFFGFFWGGGGGVWVAFHCFGFPFICKHWLDSHVLSFCSCLCSIRCMIWHSNAQHPKEPFTQSMFKN